MAQDAKLVGGPYDSLEIQVRDGYSSIQIPSHSGPEMYERSSPGVWRHTGSRLWPTPAKVVEAVKWCRRRRSIRNRLWRWFKGKVCSSEN